ncbi:TolC family protein [Cupriavidus taiwanensis]|nr:TolC family protein [Cupriavidus taiwanensis]
MPAGAIDTPDGIAILFPVRLTLDTGASAGPGFGHMLFPNLAASRAARPFPGTRLATLLAALSVALPAAAAPVPGPAGVPALAATATLAAAPAPAPTAAASAGMRATLRIPLAGMALHEAVGIAISRHPDIGRANAVVAQSEAEIAVARAAWYPKLEYGVRPGYGGSFGSGGNDMGARASVGVSQLLYDFGRTASKVSAADASLVQRRHELSDTVEQIAYNTASIYIELAASQAVMAAAQRQLETLALTRDKIGQRVRAGLSVSSDGTMADVAIQRARTEVLRARTRFDVAASRLAELIGVRPERVAELARTEDEVRSLGDEGDDIEHTPKVLAAAAAADAAHARVTLAEAERFPSVSVGVSRSMSTGRANANDDTWIGVAIAGDFSLGGLNRHRIDAARAGQRAAQQALDNERLLARTTLHSAATEAAGAAARTQSYAQMIALLRASRDLYWQEYILNKRTLTDVLNPEREIFLAEQEWIGAVADGMLARIKAHAATGRFVALLREHDSASHP